MVGLCLATSSLISCPQQNVQASTPAGDTALHLAARRRDVDMTRILVDYGALVDAVNGAGQTPLHIAAAEGDEPLVKYFYGVRANAAIADNEGNLKENSNLMHFKDWFIIMIQKSKNKKKNSFDLSDLVLLSCRSHHPQQTGVQAHITLLLQMMPLAVNLLAMRWLYEKGQ